MARIRRAIRRRLLLVGGGMAIAFLCDPRSGRDRRQALVSRFGGGNRTSPLPPWVEGEEQPVDVVAFVATGGGGDPSERAADAFIITSDQPPSANDSTHQNVLPS